MSEQPSAPVSQRLTSLDAFRGITIAGMILVNNPGDWGHIYSPLDHAEWHGWTPTDLVFPFFLFIVGVSLTFSMARRLTATGGRTAMVAQIVRRTAILLLLGLILPSFPSYEPLNGFHAGTLETTTLGLLWEMARLGAPYVLGVIGIALFFADDPLLRFGPSTSVATRKIAGAIVLVAAVAFLYESRKQFDESHLRLPGVLQRIAICYCAASLILMWTKAREQVLIATVLLLGYWAIVTFIHPPAGFSAEVVGPDGLLHEWIDQHVFGAHVWREHPDPEGLLSTLPAIATVLAGALAGHWLRRPIDAHKKVIGLFFAANVVLVLGLWWGLSFPISKKLWTSSYVLVTAGLAMHFLAMCYWLIDLRGVKGWAWPFVVFGSNAIVVYAASSMTARMMGNVKLFGIDGAPAIKTWLYGHYFSSWASPYNASLLFALCYVAIWLVPMAILHRLRIFVKV